MNSPSIVIRKATLADLAILLDLCDQLVRFDHQLDPTLDLNWSKSEAGKEQFTSRLTKSDGVVFVAEIEQNKVGYLVGGMVEPEDYRNIKNLAELEEIFVKAECRKLHVGAKLTAAFFAWCKEMQAKRISVVVTAQNLNAIAFYKKLGFNEQNLVLEAVLERD